MKIERELLQRVRETIRVTKSMLTVFSNPMEFASVNLLPQSASFTAARFANNVIISLANPLAQQRGDVACRKLHLHFEYSKWHTAGHVQEEMARHRGVRVPHPPYSLDLAIADF
jgi:hypothetical protein